MRKIPALLVMTALAAATLVGCAPAAGTANSFGCTPSAEPGAATSLVETTGDLGSAVKVRVPTPLNVKTFQRDVAVAGDGTQIVSPDQLMRASVTGVSTATGAAASLTQGPQLLRPSDLDGLAAGAGDALLCARQGDRMVIAVPADKISPDFVSNIGVTKNTGMLLVVDLDTVLLAHAAGSSVFNTQTGLPSVVRAANGQPGVVVPSSAPPKDAVTQTLIAGDGITVDTKQQAGVYLQYTAVDWQQRTVVKSTWEDHKPFAGTFAQLPGALQEAINGKAVGSQVMAVVAAAEDNGGRATVYVIDILGVEK